MIEMLKVWKGMKRCEREFQVWKGMKKFIRYEKVWKTMPFLILKVSKLFGFKETIMNFAWKGKAHVKNKSV